MFDFLETSIENSLEVADRIMEGETPTKQQTAKLIADGVSIAALSEATGLGADIIQGILNE